MKLQNLDIGVRLGLGIGAMLLAAASMLVASVVSQGQTRRSAAEAMRDNAERQDAALDMRQSLMSSAVAVRNMGLSSTVEAVQAAEAVAKSERAKYLESMQRLQGLGLTDAGQATIGKLKAIDQRMGKDFGEAVALASQFNAEQAAKLITSRIDPALAEAVEVLGQFVGAQQQALRATTEAAEGRSVDIERALAVAGGLTLLAAAAIGLWITRSIVAPLQAAMAVARTVADGDLRSNIAVSSNDETGRLLGSLQAMNQRLQVMVGEVRTSTDSIATASSEIAQGNQELSLRTEQTASNLQQASSSLQEMTEMVRHSADSARQAHQLATHAAGVAGRGGEVVARVVGTMQEIQASSRRIADITGVIDGIAFQTNILALNAAVEAARAGEQGRGFAVVASEVRSLAQRSAQAAREIKGLIGASVDKVESGTQLASDAGQTMQEVVDSVERVNTIMAEITHAAERQSDGIGQVNAAVTRLDQSTQQNAALVEQSAAAADSMKDQAQRLAGLMAVFKMT